MRQLENELKKFVQKVVASRCIVAGLNKTKLRSKYKIRLFLRTKDNHIFRGAVLKDENKSFERGNICKHTGCNPKPIFSLTFKAEFRLPIFL